METKYINDYVAFLDYHFSLSAEVLNNISNGKRKRDYIESLKAKYIPLINEQIEEMRKLPSIYKQEMLTKLLLKIASNRFDTFFHQPLY